MPKMPTEPAATYRRPLWQSLALGLIGSLVGFVLWFPAAEVLGDSSGPFRVVLALASLVIVAIVFGRRL